MTRPGPISRRRAEPMLLDVFRRDIAAPMPPVARTTDPASSHAAESEINSNGTRSAQSREVLEALKRHGPATTAELSEASGMSRHIIGRRISDLVHGGLVVRGVLRTCKVGNRMATEWCVAENRV